MLGFNKDRLYIGLYYRLQPQPGVYQWVFLVAPKGCDDYRKTTRYMVVKKLRVQADRTGADLWGLEEELLIPPAATGGLLARVLIGKIKKSRKEFEESLRAVPIVQDVPEYDSRDWTQAAIAQLAQDDVLSESSVTDWDRIVAETEAYVARKDEIGRFANLTDRIPTYDLFVNHETIP
ncbi:hypothetical protein FQN57_006661 [Myotisia sp. PD_48]|nr:hypothetical protein FQN57_006661 [Myotisia sp. PD_48]